MPNETVERLPNPRTLDPENQEIPHRPEISEILEFKLDFIMISLHRINNGAQAIIILLNVLLVVLIPGLAAIIALLLVIAGLLAGIQALLAGIFILIAFFVIRLVVPLVARRRP